MSSLKNAPFLKAQFSLIRQNSYFSIFSIQGPTCLDSWILEFSKSDHCFKSYDMYPPWGSHDPFWPLNGVKFKKSSGCRLFGPKGVYRPIFKKIYIFVDPLQSRCIVPDVLSLWSKHRGLKSSRCNVIKNMCDLSSDYRQSDILISI